MKTNASLSFLFLLSSVLFCVHASAQNIRNDTIFVNTNTLVEIKFPDKCDEAKMPMADKSFLVDKGSDKSLTIRALKNDAKPQPMLVKEGSRQHSFVLAYTENEPKKVINWSKKKELAAHVKEKDEKAAKELDRATNLYNQGAWEQSLAIYNWVLPEVDEAKQATVKTRISEIEKKILERNEKNFTDAVKKGDAFFGEKKYKEAWEAYQEALKFKKDDAATLKKAKDAGQILFRLYISNAQQSMSSKNFPDAKKYFEEAENVDSLGFQAHKKAYDGVVRKANNQLYEQLKRKGDDAFEREDWPSALSAYDSASKFIPENDAPFTKRLKETKNSLEKWITYRRNEAGYYSILSKAKFIAGKATNESDYNLAIQEYERASGLFPDRKFPKDKIKELQEMKNKK